MPINQKNETVDMRDFKDGDPLNHILNEKNIPITKEFIEGIFKKYSFSHKVKNLDQFQLAMIHISYLTRTTITDKTASLLKDVTPISKADRKNAMPLQEKCYGRLEYLGDAVMHCALAEYLFDRYKTEDEGFLTRLRIKFENNEMLSKLSKIIGLDKYAVIARNIEQSNGRKEYVGLTEDIFEAFIGALSLEVSYEKCKEFIISIVEKEIDMSELISLNDNYKERLMQYFHQMKWGDPTYDEDMSQQKTIKRGCQEIRSFTTKVKKSTGEVIGKGVGNSKAKSQKLAAYHALINLGAMKENDDDDGSDYYGEMSDDESSDNSDANKSGSRKKKINKLSDSDESDSSYEELNKKKLSKTPTKTQAKAKVSKKKLPSVTDSESDYYE